MSVFTVIESQYIEFSPKFNLYLSQIKQNALVDKLQTKILEPPINFLDLKIDKDSIMVSFLDTKRLKQLNDLNDRFSTPLRQETKIGRALRKLVPETNDNEVRPLVEAIQGYAKENETRCFLVEGDAIRKVYKWPREYCVQTSNLTGSCYQGIVNDDEFELFTNNPDRIKCAVVMLGKRLAGRALVFYGKVNGKDSILISDRNVAYAQSSIFTKFLDTISPEISRRVDGPFSLDNLNVGKPLHHFGLYYPKTADRRVTCLSTVYNEGRMQWDKGVKWYVNDGKGYTDYSCPEKLEVPDDPIAAGLEPFWP